MKVYFDEAFYQVYTADPAAAAGRMEAIVAALEDHHTFETITPAEEIDLLQVHGPRHLAYVRDRGLYDIAALAAGIGLGQSVHAGGEEDDDPAVAVQIRLATEDIGHRAVQAHGVAQTNRIADGPVQFKDVVTKPQQQADGGTDAGAAGRQP